MKPCRSTSSCQMDMALRPSDRATSMSSRYGSLVLAAGLGERFPARRSRWSPPRHWPVLPASGSVVTSLAGFAFPPAPATGRTNGDAGSLQISGCRLPANAGGLLNPTQRPAQLAQRDDLFLLLFVQDIAHIDGGYSSVRVNVLTTFSLAGFQVTTIGRFWVTAEGGGAHDSSLSVTSLVTRNDFVDPPISCRT